MVNLVDLIVPCYNSNKTLPRLLSSILSQTISDKIKVILVDDFGTDDYTNIISTFQQYLNIELVRTDKNVGPGAARRIGMKKGKGKYIMFADSDDEMFNSFSVKLLVDKIEEENCDIVYSDFLEETNDNKFITHNNDDVWVFGKIFRRSFIEKNGLYFNDTRANEDFGFNTLCRFFAKPVHLDATTYIWLKNDNSITRKNNGEYTFTCYDGQVENKIWAINEATNKKANIENINNLVVDQFIYYYFCYIRFKNEEHQKGKDYVDLDKFLSWIHRYYKEYENIIDDFFNNHKEALRISYIVQLLSYTKNVDCLYIPDKTLYDFIDILKKRA